MFRSKSFRHLALLSVGWVSASFGWWLHGSGGADILARQAAASSKQPVDQSAASTSSPREAHARSNGRSSMRADALGDLMDRVFTTDPADLTEMMNGFGALTQLTDSQVRAAWEQLSERVPSNNFGGGLTVMYLWSRMQQMGDPRELPKGWGVQDFEVALASERSRHEGGHSRENILKRLESGAEVSATERRVIFGQNLRENPLEAVKLWCRVTKPEDYQKDAPWLSTALTDPGSRDAVMAELRKWQTSGGLAEVVTSLAANWMDRDPAAVERWLQEPQQADVKDTVMKQLIDSRSLANPVETWEWSKSLSDEQRRQALIKSAVQFASTGPVEAEMGIRAIAGLKNPEDRLEVVGGFAATLAGYDIDRWQQWRNSLPAPERDAANEAAFNAWAANDTNAAVEWLRTRPAGDETNRMAGVIADFLAASDPDAAVRWLHSIPDPQRRKEAVSITLRNLGAGDLNRVRTILNALN